MLKPFNLNHLLPKYHEACRVLWEGRDKFQTELLGYLDVELTSRNGGILVVGICTLKERTRLTLISISSTGHIQQYLYLPLEAMNGLQDALQSTQLRAMVDVEPTPKRKK